MLPTDEDIAWFKSTFHPTPKATLPDDCIEYSVFVLSKTVDTANDSELRLSLREVQKFASELQRQWLKDYIWQRQGFGLQMQKEDGVSFLSGRTEYGDSIEDEWVIVWVLREISKKFQDVWIKVTDNDGEFLLIEASGTLPPWLEPDVAENRVWINDGQLKIIKPDNAYKSSKRTSEKLSPQDARNALLHDHKRLMHSMSIEEEAFYRLRNYPAQIKTNMHHALINVPRKIAFLLKHKPAYIAPAIEAFYLRDPISLKPLNARDALQKMTFPTTDIVTISLSFPKVAYAQLKSQDFPVPAVFRESTLSQSDAEHPGCSDSGIKITCGFEMLLSDALHQDKPAVREMKLLLDDLDTGDENLPTDAEIEKWSKQEDDEKWLDIDFADLEHELAGPKGKGDHDKKREFSDVAAQENLQRIVKQFEKFLNDDKAGPDGAGLFAEDNDTDDDGEDLDDDDDDDDECDFDEDKEASFNEDDFSKFMQEMMGMPPEVMQEMMTGKLAPGSEGSRTRSKPNTKSTGRVDELDSASSDEDEEDMEKIMNQMESELRGHGALDLNSSSSKSAETKRAIKGKATEAESSDEDENGDNGIDINLARNLLESFKAQSGASGPGGNMMGLMGLRLPRDEQDNHDVAGPSHNQPK